MERTGTPLWTHRWRQREAAAKSEHTIHEGMPAAGTGWAILREANGTTSTKMAALSSHPEAVCLTTRRYLDEMQACPLQDHLD